MALTVLSVSFPFSPVTPDAAGGAEQVLAYIDRYLVSCGHRSIVIGPDGSRVCGELVATPAVKTTIDHAAWRLAHNFHRRAIADVLATRRVDLIHMHGVDFQAYLPDADLPTVATLHVPVDWYHRSLFRLSRPRLALACVSHAQRRSLPAMAVPVRVIPNGVPLADLPSGSAVRRSFALVLCRICPEKGVHRAFSAAQRARIPLLLAGHVSAFETHRRYYRDTIAPRLDRTRRFIGAVGPRRKQRLLSAARCLLVPSLASETSSLVAMEAMACGTPVIAFASGALPEIVQHGVTGYLVNSVEEMADAIAAADCIDPRACRARAEARFSARRMGDEYAALYQNLTRQ
jgi:glycosyltransferase involved in cell wall biosynthesis